MGRPTGRIEVNLYFLFWYFFRVNFKDIIAVKNYFLFFYFTKVFVSFKSKKYISWSKPRFNKYTKTFNKYRHKKILPIINSYFYKKFRLFSPTKFFLNKFKKLWFKRKIYRVLKMYRKRFKKKFIKTLQLKYYNFYNSVKKNYKTTLKTFSLSQRLFISVKGLNRKIYYILYKGNKLTKRPKIKDRKKLTFLNFNKKPIWKMRKARFAHWNLRLTGTLNKYRYDKLLARELNFYLFKYSKYTFLAMIFLNFYGFFFTWKQVYKLVNYNLVCVNGLYSNSYEPFSAGDIIEFPSGFNFLTFKNLIDSKFTILLRRAKKRVYTDNFFFRKKKLKLRKYKVHKIFKKLSLSLIKNSINITHDPTINVICILNIKKNFYYNPEYSLVKHSVLGLQNWRYNFD